MTNNRVGYINYTGCTTEVFLQTHLMYIVIALGKCNHIIGVATTELINCLVIISYNADVCASFCNAKNKFFLQIVYILILVNNEILDSRQVFLNLSVAFNLPECFEDHQRKVDISSAVQTRNIFVQHISMFLCPSVGIFVIVNHLVNALQKQIDIARVGFQLQITHATFGTISGNKQMAFYGVENLIFPKLLRVFVK